MLDEAIAFATQPNLHERVDDVSEWFDVWVVDALTRPPSPEPGIDPREADKGMELPGGLKVNRRLGTGGTALVLHVRREGRDFALKVPHDEGCAERLLAEAKVLRELRHEHIVEFRELLTLGGRPCLLLQFAGEQTLGELLQKEGALSLELAKRFGDDLLSAVQYLEETGVTHRDIKPGNVGFTSQAKKKQHLLLLDFSLAGADETATHAGTAEWRDPWLYLRGRWDAAADRWAAAAVLYLAVTGAKLSRGETDEVIIDAERFDAAVRDQLADFFRKVFHRDPAQRFDSAEAMRQAWTHALIADDADKRIRVRRHRPLAGPSHDADRRAAALGPCPKRAGSRRRADRGRAPAAPPKPALRRPRRGQERRPRDHRVRRPPARTSHD